MYRVMLIDDEVSARSLLKASINWNELNMDVVGEASSGIEAINIIDEIRPDIAFVDINMPFMNGIEFTQVATQRYPDLNIIIMTAYDDFEYARKCVSLPVTEYMLKPFVRTEVIEVLEKLRAQLDAKDSTSKDQFDDIEISQIDKVKNYILSNYTDSKINLTSVAQEFGFNPSYFSRKFKQETGKNFLEFLTECRMERAIKMAQANIKMFNASMEVGIPDPNYFGRCFKKYTGMSYSEYVNKSNNG